MGIELPPDFKEFLKLLNYRFAPSYNQQKSCRPSEGPGRSGKPATIVTPLDLGISCLPASNPSHKLCLCYHPRRGCQPVNLAFDDAGFRRAISGDVGVRNHSQHRVSSPALPHPADHLSHGEVELFVQARQQRLEPAPLFFQRSAAGQVNVKAEQTGHNGGLMLRFQIVQKRTGGLNLDVPVHRRKIKTHFIQNWV